MKLVPVQPIPESVYKKVGFYWYETPESPPYIADELIVISPEEGDAYYRAAGELYDLFIAAGQHVIDHRLYEELDIPPTLIPLIEETWNDDAHFHLIGRFDLAGGLDGQPIKLIEFNADTPSLIFEVALIQWLLLRHNNLDEERQYNRLYETLKESFTRIRKYHTPAGEDDSPIPCALFSCFNLGREDENTTRLLEEIAYESGFITSFEYIEDVTFSGEKGIGNSEGEVCDYWFKLVPYELMVSEEPELVKMLTAIVGNRKTVLLNPPYTLLFQSKGLLKILWDLFPRHPLLLETTREPLPGKSWVEKKTFGREGANIRILGPIGELLASTPGEYQNFQAIYQEFTELPRDSAGKSYQAGVFFSYEPCGLGFRRESGIIQNFSQFIGHFVG
ncbi:MAG: glutathionylspermidine synthase family protein [Deltaproteobacteria bacterium]|nr:glutathionylspermidine synthase family protein [Deltaproteobacteria bacterium]